MDHQDGPCFSVEDVEILEKISVYEGFFKMQRLKLRHKLINGGWSKELTRECFIRPEAVAVLLYDPYKDNVVLLEQFRIGTLDAHEGPWQMELVAGIVEEGESTQDVAHREAEEEAGTEILDLEYIYEFYPSAGGSSEKITLYCGGIDSTGVGGVHGVEEEGEDIWVQVFSRKEAMHALSENYISNAAGIIALQWLDANWKRLQQKWQ
ncbi:ADP-ribose diphosphatase [Gammaproteobacteria bacterium 45_16_T64]|nr:ADP-ribose diphosphatase [Gammaproteobacteria bacterium 45_16_T64]